MEKLRLKNQDLSATTYPRGTLGGAVVPGSDALSNSEYFPQRGYDSSPDTGKGASVPDSPELEGGQEVRTMLERPVGQEGGQLWSPGALGFARSEVPGESARKPHESIELDGLSAPPTPAKDGAPTIRPVVGNEPVGGPDTGKEVVSNVNAGNETKGAGGLMVGRSVSSGTWKPLPATPLSGTTQIATGERPQTSARGSWAGYMSPETALAGGWKDSASR
jgi:hypothetical protein